MNFMKLMAVGVALGCLVVNPAQARPGLIAGLPKIKSANALTKVQLKLPFGMSPGKVREMLSRDGYGEIDVTYVGIIDAKAEACRNGVRYSVKVRINGSYEYRNEIGKCRPVIRANAVDDILRKDGYSKIDMDDDNSAPYDVTACRRGERYGIEVNEFGDVKVKGRLGKCAPDMLSPRDVRRALRKDGFDRIKFTDRTPPRFVVEACKGDRKIRLNIDRRGAIRDRERIGRCAAPIKPDSITAMLERDGYNRVDVVDAKPPRYRAEACNAANDRMRIAISPWGDRIRERKIGQCAPAATAASIREQLGKSNRDLKVLRVIEGGAHAFTGDVCFNKERFEIHFSKWGQYIDRKRIGTCESPRLENIYGRYEKDGLSRMQTFIEGCTQRGRRVRVTLDEFGTELSRERIGRCN